MSVRPKLREIAEAVGDPRDTHLAALGDISGIEVFHNEVLVMTYIEPEKTAGGIIKADRTLQENRFQGKCALVLKCGPLAFQDDGVCKFGGVKVVPGDWVLVRPSDGMEMFVVDRGGSTGVSCRMFLDQHIKGRLSHPGLIY